MDENKSGHSFGRRELLKLLPTTAACFSIFPSSTPLSNSPSEAERPEPQLEAEESPDRLASDFAGAEWIWEPIETMRGQFQTRVAIASTPSFRNLFTYFRKTINLREGAEKASVRITGDSRYQFFVNGQFVGRGPVRSSRILQYYDEYEVGTFLRAGRNAFAVLLHFYGENTGWYMLSRPGLLFHTQIMAGSGKIISMTSDSSWKFLRSEAYLQKAPRKNGALGFVEICDARRVPSSWTEADFNDSSWQGASVVSRDSNPSDMPTVLPPFPPENLAPRGIPVLLEQEIVPSRIVQIGETRTLAGGDALPPAEQMQQERIDSITACRIANVDSLLQSNAEQKEPGVQAHPSQGSSISTIEGRNAVIVLDFGRELTGYPHLELDGIDGAVVDIGVSESLLEGRVTPTRNGLHCNRYIMRGGRQVWQAFEWDGFRYLQLTFRNCARPVWLRKIAVIFTSYPVGNRGSFESSDEQLNKIWEISRHTLQLCMHDAFEDCPNREQRQWVGDAYVESKVNYSVFGDTKLAAKFLRQTAQSQRSDGIIAMYYPGDVEIDGPLTIKDFVLHWVSALWEYYRFTGDDSIVRELYPNLRSAMDWFSARIGANGLLCDVPPWIFYDWADLDKRGESTILNAFLYHALRESSELAALLGKDNDEIRFQTVADRIKSALNERLWDERRGVYVDSRIAQEQTQRVSQQANSLCILYGIAAPEKWDSILEYVFAKERVRGWEGPSIPALITSPLKPLVRSRQNFDEEHDVVQAQPFFLHWVNAALAKAGDYHRMLAIIRQGFGKMLEAGATTTWETWSPDASECHGWSTTSAHDLLAYILGIRMVKPACAEFVIEPNPSDLQWARGRVASLRGDIAVHWQNSNLEFRIEGEIPEGSEASVLVPLRSQSWPSTVLLNGKAIPIVSGRPTGLSARKEEHGIRVPLSRAGHFEIVAGYSQAK